MNAINENQQKEKIIVQELVSLLTIEQQQLLKDTIIHGYWRRGYGMFLDENGKCESVGMFGYSTNNAKEAGHFNGRKISAMFKLMYRKLCTEDNNYIGRYISHCKDCWTDEPGGDMLFIRDSINSAFNYWARQE